jgi:deoxycytidylate deaminase
MEPASLVAAVGRSVERFALSHQQIRLSSWLAEAPEGKDIDSSSEFQRIYTSMQAGTRLRQRRRRGDALVAYVAAEIRAARRDAVPPASAPEGEDRLEPRYNHCFILRSLKHKDEVSRLRALYRDQFVLIGVYCPRARRVEALAAKLADSEGGGADRQRENAEKLIAIDEHEHGTDFGQNVRDAFPLADAFVTGDNLQREVDRIFDLVFSAPFETPTPDEQGMFLAHAAAVRSAALARQVGACICAPGGDVLAVGCNEVPRAGGDSTGGVMSQTVVTSSSGTTAIID